MYSALYYPHKEIRNESILKNALLLWDRIDYITPFELDGYHGPDELASAHNLIANGRVPQESEKRLAHDAILELATSDLPENYFMTEHVRDDDYQIYPAKFMRETWEALEETRLATRIHDRDNSLWNVQSEIGLTMMAVLAESCAGNELRTVTDKGLAHALLQGAISGLHNGRNCHPYEPVDRLVNIAVKVVDADALSLSTLVEFREREIGSAEGVYIRGLRHNFLKRIDNYAARFPAEIDSGASPQEIERQFEQEMQDDLSNLKEALKLNRENVLYSKSVGVIAFATAGMVFPHLAVPISGVAAWSLLGEARRYNQSRRTKLRQHAMSWLYDISQPKVTDYLYRLGPFPALG